MTGSWSYGGRSGVPGVRWWAVGVIVALTVVSPLAHGDGGSAAPASPAAPTSWEEASRLAEERSWDANANVNAALAAAAEERLGMAVLYLERAQRLRPLDRSAREALHLVREQVRRQRVQAFPNDRLTQGEPAAVWWWRLFGVFPQRFHALAALVLVWLACGLWWYRSRMPGSLRRDTVAVSSVGLALLAVVALAFWGGALFTHSRYEPVVVTAAAPRYHEAPDRLARRGRDPDLYEGAVVVVRGRERGWVQVELADRDLVWVPEQSVAAIGAF